MDISHLTRQHKEIREALNNLEQKIVIEEQVAENAFDLTLALANIAGKLKIHLGSEDKHLYPFLLKSSDPKVQTTTQNFIAEMGQLAGIFDNYKSTYMNVKNIKNSPGEFIKETKIILKAIIMRIEKEETELYTLLSTL